MNQYPIVLCHAACSGGTLLYRLIVTLFNLQGVSEISHCSPASNSQFLPWDPEHLLMLNGKISLSDFGDIFFDRVRACEKLCCSSGDRLLIREHTHSYFFKDIPDSEVPNGPSWIAEQYAKRLGKTLKCIVTVRDPVDSWLGLINSFSHEAPTDFAEYCDRYKKFIVSVRANWDNETMLLVRYEDVITNEEKEFQRISEFINISTDTDSKKPWWNVPSSGSSGRQSSTLEIRPRRPFRISLVRRAQASDSYDWLARNLGYPKLHETITTTGKVRAVLYPVLQVLFRLVRRCRNRRRLW